MSSNRVSAWLSVLVLAAALWATAAPGIRAQNEEGPLPVHFRAPHVLIDAPVESTDVEDGNMAAVTGLWNAGVVEGGPRLDEPGFSIFHGMTQFVDTPFGAFFYLQDSAPGQVVTVTGSDGAEYDFEIDSVEVLPPDQAVRSLLQAPEGAKSWIVVFSWARYDASLGASPGIVMVKAVRTSDPPRKVEQGVETPADPVSGCAELSYLPPQAWYAGAAQMQVSSAELADPALIAELEVPLDATVPGCDVEIKSAIRLWDGNVLALIGPTGQISSSDLDNAVDENVPAVTDYDRAGMFQFVLFINQGGSWAVNRGPIS